MKTILVTAFEPFGGDVLNPSQMVLEALPDDDPAVTLRRLLLPVSYDRAARLLKQEMLRLRPDCVLSLGQAGGRKTVTVERIAVNLQDGGSPDSDGIVRRDCPVEEGAPDAYFSTLPVRILRDAVEREGVACALSLSAGTYVCNTVMYTALRTADAAGLPAKAGFLHLPYIPEQGKTPCIPLSDALTAVKCAVRTLGTTGA